ncbi:MAG: decarboxylating NADP(+)-dependent phosphogluconate dehydrogenase [Deltaproteobacteria bacterium]|nr:decarboxylating NADP(+)-dependent phosphogluconate dehydrogenase [Deltaproteobacteria bacterium]
MTMERETQADIAVIGLAVMGQNLILNMNDHGYTVAAYNRTVSRVDQFMAGPARGSRVIGAHSLEAMVARLKRPRRVMLMVKAGKPVDDFIALLLSHLVPGDVIIDGGNSQFTDTIRRTKWMEDKGLLYIGTGISGGEEGARRGPSIMPGGNPKAWPLVKGLFQAIAAKTPDGSPCCEWVGADGAGHYVKMIHNGIEYGDMQIIAEAYHVMREGLALTHAEMHRIFGRWNAGDLQSYLIEITRDIMAFPDTDGQPLLEKILDSAGQKGTGKWTGINSLDLGIPVTLISEAVYARCLSALRDERLAASPALSGPRTKYKGNAKTLVTDLRNALLAAKLVSYAQGFMLMREAAREYRWNLDFGKIALLWRAGCIIRSSFLERITDAFTRSPGLPNLLLDDYFNRIIQKCQGSWRRVVIEAVRLGIPLPAISAALAFYDGYRSARLPANLIQAQRDYFGAHTYERVDRPRGEFLHTQWMVE